MPNDTPNDLDAARLVHGATVVLEETFCCGYKRCPTVKLWSDGSATIEDNGQRIDFNPEQLVALGRTLIRFTIETTTEPGEGG